MTLNSGARRTSFTTVFGRRIGEGGGEKKKKKKVRFVLALAAGEQLAPAGSNIIALAGCGRPSLRSLLIVKMYTILNKDIKVMRGFMPPLLLFEGDNS